MKKKFWCHYIGRDGNTPKRRCIELTNLSELLPKVVNSNCPTPLWYEFEDDHYELYAQLNEKVAVLVNQYSIYKRHLDEYLDKTDADIDGEWTEWWNNYKKSYPRQSEERRAENKAYFKRIRCDDVKACRDAALAKIAELQDYGNFLASGEVWVTAAALRGFEEAQSPYGFILKEIRRIKLEEREERTRQRRAAEEKAREEKARKEAEEKVQLAKKIADEEESLRTTGEISGWAVVQLCDREGIPIHLRTRHNLLEVVTSFTNHGNSAHYWRGKRKPVLDGCFATLNQLKKKLNIA